MAPPGWPQLYLEAALVPAAPVQAPGTFTLDDAADGVLDTSTLGADSAWNDLTQWMQSGSISRPATRTAGPLWSSGQGTASFPLRNDDGRFDPDNLAGPYVSGGKTQLNAMAQVRLRAVYGDTEYALFSGFADSWQPEDGRNYGGRYAQAALSATDGQKVLAGITIAAIPSPIHAGDTTGTRVNRILDEAKWYSGTRYRDVDTGQSTVQAFAAGASAWSLLQDAADAEIGELYLDGAGKLVFRDRHAILAEARSNSVQAVFGDRPGTVQADGAELPYASVARARDDTTLSNDIQAQIAGDAGTLQEVADTDSEGTYLFLRTYPRTDLQLQNDADALLWAQWVLYVAKSDADRFGQLVISPRRDAANLWPQVLGRQIGDRIQVWRRPPGVTDPITRDCFIRGIQHDFNVSTGDWVTTWTLQDATRYGSFFTLDNDTLGALDANALAY